MTREEEVVRERLTARRDRLAELTRERPEERLVELMRRVDAALAAMEIGEWGVCEECQEPISRRRMAADPLLRVCIECLSEEARHALERDLEAAAQIQRRLLPERRVRHCEWEIAYLWEPHGAVSGDHVDVLRPQASGEPLHLILGDVVGKGVGASFLQSNLHALFHALSGAQLALPELVRRANRLFADATGSASYATLTALALGDGGRLALANAGHPRPLFADARGVRPIEGAGLPLGLFGDSTYAAHELSVQPGETLLLYSDGWTEAAKGEEEYGIGRAAAALRRAAHLPLEELLAACRDDVDAFLAGGRRSDDLTLLAIRRTPDSTGATPF
ncbi:MAG: PP2C family protein-serine/threonine phosphatase [Thermoanaerobaculia bacterium]